jgi:glycerol-3-phosphate dehydrogenase
LRAGLVERNDFASGTSSRSSKLVHGGLRYLKEGKIALTRESVHERGELLRTAPGLVDPVSFLMPHYRKRKPSRATLAFGLAIYDVLAQSWQHRYVDAHAALDLVPSLDPDGLTGAHTYMDAATDDARLVLRLLAQACDAGATAINYASASPLLDAGGSLEGVRIAGGPNGDIDVRAKATIAATGVFADELRTALGGGTRLRPLRGSHIILPDWRLPLAQCVAFEHPADGRPVFAYPWMGRVLAGTTDLDYDGPLEREPAILAHEVAYLVAALRHQFPAQRIDPGDIIATYAGIRPIVDGHATDPSKASRDHVVWNERGLITITGGKMTTFRPMAMDALLAAAPQLPAFDRSPHPAFSAAAPPVVRLPAHVRQRLAGRYGERAQAFVDASDSGEFESIDGTGFLWAELRWAARHEAVVHLDDLLLRRTRIGLLLERGGARHFERIATICREELGWDDARWTQERDAYRARWAQHYSIPEGAMPDWREYL